MLCKLTFDPFQLITVCKIKLVSHYKCEGKQRTKKLRLTGSLISTTDKNIKKGQITLKSDENTTENYIHIGTLVI